VRLTGISEPNEARQALRFGWVWRRRCGRGCEKMEENGRFEIPGAVKQAGEQKSHAASEASAPPGRSVPTARGWPAVGALRLQRPADQPINHR
jgi:hypothetical protein